MLMIMVYVELIFNYDDAKIGIILDYRCQKIALGVRKTGVRCLKKAFF